MLIARNVVSLKTESILAVLLRSLAHTVFYFCVPALFMEEVCINLRMSSRACRILCNNIQNVFFPPKVVKLRKEVKRVRVLVIRKLVRSVGRLKSKKLVV